MESQQIAIPCDEICTSMLVNDNLKPMSDEDFAMELQLQEVIVSSLIALQGSGDDRSPPPGKVTKEIEEPGDHRSPPPGKVTMEIEEPSTKASKEAGEPSQSLCEICAEKKDVADMFPLRSCSHSFCSDCVSKHVSITIKNLRTSEKGLVVCPAVDCTTVLDLETGRQILHEDVITMWGDALCELAISPSEKFFCPFRDCSAMMVKESGDGAAVREAECPFCRRLFCAECEVPWHSGVDCEEYARLREDEKGSQDLMVHCLAKENKWKKCPSCKFYIERTEGCLHMTCRCGFEFCYACGDAWTSTHGSCQ